MLGFRLEDLGFGAEGGEGRVPRDVLRAGSCHLEATVCSISCGRIMFRYWHGFSRHRTIEGWFGEYAEHLDHASGWETWSGGLRLSLPQVESVSKARCSAQSYSPNAHEPLFSHLAILVTTIPGPVM